MTYLKTLLFAVILLFVFTSGSKTVSELEKNPPFLIHKGKWADSVFAKMSLDEKLGQLFNVAAYSNKDEKHKKELSQLIEKYHIGGLTFFQGGPYRQAKLTNHYQSLAKIPLMIAIDGEWGLSMRLDSTLKYPWQMSLGAIQDEKLIYEMGADVAKQLKRLGVHVNFAPVIDVNNNPNNPVINARSFGEDRAQVASKGIAYMKGLQDNGVLACAKHFPGHGDTDSDSHKTLPMISHNRERIDSIELYPFRELIDKGLGSIMSAHLYLPAYSKLPNTASSLSPLIVDSILQQQMGFEGLIFTDALNMKGVSNYFESHEIDLKALQAGNDILLLSQDVPKAIKFIKKALADSLISMEQIDESCLKILKAKEWLGLDKKPQIKLKNLLKDLNKAEYQSLNWKLTKASMTVLANKKKIIPITELQGLKLATLSIGSKEKTEFQKYVDQYKKADHFNVEDLPTGDQKSLLDTLLNYDLVLLGIHTSNANPWVKYEISSDVKDFINLLRLNQKVILTVFSNAYSLQDFLAANYVDGLIMAYQNSNFSQQIATQVIFGALGANGKLPVSISKNIKAGDGLLLKVGNAMKYSLPELVGVSSNLLSQIDSIVYKGMKAKAFPGAQVLVARNGEVIYHKAFGKHTYEGNQKVELNNLYDIASITKIASTLLCVMELDSKGKLSLEDPLKEHLKMVKGTPYANLTLREILAHQSGLAPWIPFYKKTLFHGMPRFDIYSKGKSEHYPLRVAENLYISDSYEDSIFNQIVYHTKISENKEYSYSDLGYYFLKEIVEDKVNMPINEYVQKRFYEPMGMDYTTFLPREKFPLSQIVPTELDMTFRKQLIHGDVHDQGAAMLGGVGGHAGLFSNTNDLAKLMQMYLNRGVFNGERYLKSEVVKEYTACQFCRDSLLTSTDDNRRAAGFDKPAYRGNPGPTCDCVSYYSFGHSGFTGTISWSDPAENIVYIFLSNRVYPSAENNLLSKMDIRTKIQNAIHSAIYISKSQQELIDSVSSTSRKPQ